MGDFSSLGTAAGIAAGAVLALYLLAIRPWHLRWGASEEEARQPMPGDDVVERPMLDATRASTIEASPGDVWPWIVQMGYGRAGFYSYDWIDNRGIPSADSILPDWQSLKVGDVLPTGPGGGFRIEAIDPSRSILMVIRERYVQMSALYLLNALAGERTRLVVRLRARFGPGLLPFLYFLLFEPGDFVMMRKMMLGIKERAERARRT